MSSGIDLLLLVAVALLAVAAGIDLLRGNLRERRDRRSLERLRPAGPERQDEDEDERFEPRGAIERRLRAAALPIGTLTFLGASALLAALAATALVSLFPAVPVAAVCGGLLAAYLPWTSVGTLGRWRSHRFESALADALGFMIGSLEAGENPLQAFTSAAEASQGAVRREFAEVAHRLRLGMSIRRALRPIAEGYDSEGVRLFVQSIIAKWQAGGDLVPILQSVARIIRERLAVRLRLRSHLAGARVAAVMVALLPYAVIPVYLWKMPDMLDQLLGHPLGPSLLAVAILVQVVGWLWLGRILRIEL